MEGLAAEQTNALATLSKELTHIWKTLVLGKLKRQRRRETTGKWRWVGWHLARWCRFGDKGYQLVKVDRKSLVCCRSCGCEDGHRLAAGWTELNPFHLLGWKVLSFRAYKDTKVVILPLQENLRLVMDGGPQHLLELLLRWFWIPRSEKWQSLLICSLKKLFESSWAL